MASIIKKYLFSFCLMLLGLSFTGIIYAAEQCELTVVNKAKGELVDMKRRTIVVKFDIWVNQIKVPYGQSYTVKTESNAPFSLACNSELNPGTACSKSITGANDSFYTGIGCGKFVVTITDQDPRYGRMHVQKQ